MNNHTNKKEDNLRVGTEPDGTIHLNIGFTDVYLQPYEERFQNLPVYDIWMHGMVPVNPPEYWGSRYTILYYGRNRHGSLMMGCPSFWRRAYGIIFCREDWSEDMTDIFDEDEYIDYLSNSNIKIR